MREITKDIEITIDGTPVGFRITKLDAFSGVALLRLLLNDRFVHVFLLM